MSLRRRAEVLEGRHTYRSYRRICGEAELAGDPRRYELIDGVIHVSPGPIVFHQIIVGRIYVLLLAHVTAHFPELYAVLGANSRLAITTVCEPDVLVVERSALDFTKASLEVPPRVVVEVLSPKTMTKDRTIKRDAYAKAGVVEYWIVDPKKQTVARYDAPFEGSDPTLVFAATSRFESRVLRGFGFEVASIFFPLT